jgi:hypothetical protein
MRKILLVAAVMFITVFSVFSIDSEKAKIAVSDGLYIPALIDYGFSEQQISSWAKDVGDTIKNYLKDLKDRGIYSRGETLASMNLQMSIKNKQITENDKAKIELFINDIKAFWINELKKEEEAKKKKAQSAEEQRQQERSAEVQKQKQYAQSFGLDDSYYGIYDILLNINSENFERAKRRMIIPDNPDQAFSVQNTVDGYVIYSITIGGRLHQIALKPERGKTYIENSQIDVNSVYKIEGTRKFTRSIGGTVEIIVISRLGQRR